jgi:hypothetical protein
MPVLSASQVTFYQSGLPTLIAALVNNHWNLFLEDGTQITNSQQVQEQGAIIKLLYDVLEGKVALDVPDNYNFIVLTATILSWYNQAKQISNSTRDATLGTLSL